MPVAGIGVMAVATDLLAVRLRRPAIAGLPLLVLFCVPLTTECTRARSGEMAVFCLGMAGYLALLAVDGRERLRLWGRLVTLWQRGQDPTGGTGPGPDTKDLAAAGRRIGLAAVVIALFIPLLVPGLREHKLFAGPGRRAAAGGRPSPAQPAGPDEQPTARAATRCDVLSYQTTDADPQYLQVYVLNNLTTQTWTLAPTAGSYRARREAARHRRG